MAKEQQNHSQHMQHMYEKQDSPSTRRRSTLDSLASIFINKTPGGSTPGTTPSHPQRYTEVAVIVDPLRTSSMTRRLRQQSASAAGPWTRQTSNSASSSTNRLPLRQQISTTHTRQFGVLGRQQRSASAAIASAKIITDSIDHRLRPTITIAIDPPRSTSTT